jgi:hypothetical protein
LIVKSFLNVYPNPQDCAAFTLIGEAESAMGRSGGVAERITLGYLILLQRLRSGKQMRLGWGDRRTCTFEVKIVASIGDRMLLQMPKP